jgi:hypothetical protein
MWISKVCGKSQYDERIVRLEARAVLKSARRIAVTTFGHDLRRLFLCDDMGVLLAFERLLVTLRVFCAYSLARNIFVSIRWIPSELTHSDEPSRIFDD